MPMDPARPVVLAGISAALHVGKLPPALPALAEALGSTLMQAGFLLSLVQLAGMALGLVIGLLADALGLKRTLVSGLLLLSAAGFAGGLATDISVLLTLRRSKAAFSPASMPATRPHTCLVPAPTFALALGSGVLTCSWHSAPLLAGHTLIDRADGRRVGG